MDIRSHIELSLSCFRFKLFILLLLISSTFHLIIHRAKNNLTLWSDAQRERELYLGISARCVYVKEMYETRI